MIERLTELELRYTEQQEFIQQLSNALYEQQRQLDRLQSELAVLKQKLQAEPGLVDAGPSERPPHY